MPLPVAGQPTLTPEDQIVHIGGTDGEGELDDFDGKGNQKAGKSDFFEGVDVFVSHPLFLIYIKPIDK